VNRPISFADLKAQHESLEPEISQALQRVITAGNFVLGPETRAFERELAELCGAPHCVGCASGSDALQLALQGLGVGAGDEVIVPAFTFFATAQSVIAAGATPTFVDVDPETGLINGELIEERISPRTRAIVPVHLFGRVCDMSVITQLARRHDLRVVEDAAQAHGASRAGLRAGSLGDAAAFSFYPG
jgi:dTDP-4-amino-4,6-dideoxygalactose transaminase